MYVYPHKYVSRSISMSISISISISIYMYSFLASRLFDRNHAQERICACAGVFLSFCNHDKKQGPPNYGLRTTAQRPHRGRKKEGSGKGNDMASTSDEDAIINGASSSTIETASTSARAPQPTKWRAPATRDQRPATRRAPAQRAPKPTIWLAPAKRAPQPVRIRSPSHGRETRGIQTKARGGNAASGRMTKG